MNAMTRNWKRLIEFGVKASGTPEKELAERFIYDYMAQLCCGARVDEFTAEGWRCTGESHLSVIDPPLGPLRSFVFLGSGGGAFDGQLVRLGVNHVWNMYGWDRYAVMKDLDIQGYVSGRIDGDALSQTLIEGNSTLPHFIIGSEDNARLSALLDEGEVVRVAGEAKCERVANMRFANIIAPFQGSRRGGRGVLVTAHYDTMYNTPGGYDNQAGVAVLMALGEMLSQQKPKRDVTLLFTDGEECRLTGARHFAHSIAPESLGYILNIDGVGRGDEMEVWCGPESFERKVFRLLLDDRRAPKKRYRNPPPPGSDHAPFYDMGVDVVMLTFNDQGIIHTPLDGYNERIIPNMESMKALAWTLLNELEID